MEKNIFGLKYIYITQLQSLRFMLDFQDFKTILIISKFLLVLFAYNQDSWEIFLIKVKWVKNFW